MSIPIPNANGTLLDQNPGTLPDVNDVLTDYFQPMNFEVITKSTVNFQLVETQVTTNFQGVWQPFTDRQLMMYPEGQRAWGWFMLHADPSLMLRDDDVVIYKNVQYRVMAKRDYTDYGYVEYHLINDYTGSGP